MAQKEKTSHLSDTINALDSAVDQWNSITNNEESAQASDPSDLQKSTQELLHRLREQLDEFAPAESEDALTPANHNLAEPLPADS